MTETNIATQTVQFIENDRPSLQAGTYTIKVTQALSNAEIKPDEKFSSTRTFHVEGDQFSLNPQTVYSVFPPASSRGSYTHVLPSIILKRSTLPWERSAALPAWEQKAPGDAAEKSRNGNAAEKSPNSEAPWLALLLFHEGEVAKPEVVTVGKLTPAPKASPTQNKEDLVSLLQIPTELLKKLLPSHADLKLLSHVRKGTHEDSSQIELSVVIGNRLPKPGINTVHLVSLEAFFDLKVESEAHKKQEEPQQKIDKNNGNFMAVVSLHSWDFVCEATNRQEHFSNLLMNLDVGTLNLSRLPSKDESVKDEAAEDEAAEDKAVKDKAVKDKAVKDKAAEDKAVEDKAVNLYLKKGYVPLKHHLRNFQTTISWYHSPLLPGENQHPFSFNFPVRAADELLIYDREIGIFDSSYAAAWQLGRLLALQDKSLSVNLFNWKRQYLQQQMTIGTIENPPSDSSNQNKSSNQSTEIDQNSIQFLFQSRETNTTSESVPQSILNWFQNLLLLDSIPFNYLVPDPDLLPLESLRFFQIDSTWLECAIDGAFGIGDVLTQETYYQQCKQKVLASIKNPKPVTGFLLRSQLIEDYPSLEVKGMNSEGKVLDFLRFERLSSTVMICLFSEVLTSLTINQKPEALHFGFKEKDGQMFVDLPKPTPGDSLNTIDKYKLTEGDWLDADLGMLNIVQLSQNIKQQDVNKKHYFTALNLPLELLKGSCIFRFAVNEKH